MRVRRLGGFLALASVMLGLGACATTSGTMVGDGKNLKVGRVALVTVWRDGKSACLSDADARLVACAMNGAKYSGPGELACPYGLSVLADGEEVWYKTDGLSISLIDGTDFYRLNFGIADLLARYAGD